MGAMQRRKGRAGEQEVVNLAKSHGLEARRTWQTATSPDAVERCCDLRISGKRVQCKRRKRAWSDLYAALCGVDLVACRSDNLPWLVVMRFEDWLHEHAN